MALKNNIGKLNLPTLITRWLNIVESAEDTVLYIKIEDVISNKSTNVLTVKGYNLVKDVITPTSIVLKYSHDLDLEGGNNLQQGYNYLKTLPEFIDCEDC